MATIIHKCRPFVILIIKFLFVMSNMVQSYAYVMLLLILLFSPLYVKSSLPQTACVIDSHETDHEWAYCIHMDRLNLFYQKTVLRIICIASIIQL